MSHGHIVEEEQRFRTLGEHIVDTHRHGVNAHGVVPVHGERYLQLGTHAVGPADEHRLLQAERGEVEHASERTYAAHGTLAGSRGDMLFDAADNLVSCLQVHTCVFV